MTLFSWKASCVTPRHVIRCSTSYFLAQRLSVTGCLQGPRSLPLSGELAAQGRRCPQSRPGSRFLQHSSRAAHTDNMLAGGPLRPRRSPEGQTEEREGDMLNPPAIHPQIFTEVPFFLTLSWCLKLSGFMRSSRHRILSFINISTCGNLEACRPCSAMSFWTILKSHPKGTPSRYCPRLSSQRRINERMSKVSPVFLRLLKRNGRGKR